MPPGFCPWPQSWRRAPRIWLDTPPSHARGVPWRASRSSCVLRRSCANAPRAAPVRRESTCHRDVRRVRRLGFGHQPGDLRLQLRLDLARVFIRQRAVPAGVGMDFRTASPIVPMFSRPSRAPAAAPERQPLDLLEKSSPNAAIVSWSDIVSRYEANATSHRSPAPACARIRPSHSHKQMPSSIRIYTQSKPHNRRSSRKVEPLYHIHKTRQASPLPHHSPHHTTQPSRP